MRRMIFTRLLSIAPTSEFCTDDDDSISRRHPKHFYSPLRPQFLDVLKTDLEISPCSRQAPSLSRMRSRGVQKKITVIRQISISYTCRSASFRIGERSREYRMPNSNRKSRSFQRDSITLSRYHAEKLVIVNFL